ncbi:MAG TPA: hypothetical protein VF456_19375 [Vicinamibacterales bacterium]
MKDVAVPRRIATIAAGTAALMCGWLVILHLRMIVSPAPQEMREGAMIWLTRLVLEGRNPYVLSELPASSYAYGIVYRAVVLPFARLFGNGYTVHRAVSAVSIAGACAVLYHLLRRQGTTFLLSAIGVMLFYASSVYFVAPLARPDGLGVFFCLASIACLFTTDKLRLKPDTTDLTAGWFAAGLIFGLLALLTKIYLAFPPFIMSLYVFLFVSPKRGLMYGVATLTAAIVTLYTMTLFYPAYITMSLVDNMNSAAYYNLDHMKRQTLDWLLYSLPLTVALVILLVRAVMRTSPAQWIRSTPSPFAFAAAVNATVFFCIFAGHAGAHMTYMFHLVTPLLLLAMWPSFDERSWAGAMVAIALPIAFIANAHYFPLTFGRFRAAEATFAQLSDVIRAHQCVLGSTEVAGPLALAGQPVFDSGHSQYFGEAAIKSRIPGLVPAESIDARWKAFLTEIKSGIVDGRFDLIIRNRRPGLIPDRLVAAHYKRVATIDVDLPWGAQRWPLDLWEPIR